MQAGQDEPRHDGDRERERSLRAEQVEATRLAIVAAARRLFGTRGYAATSVDDIAADARVTKGAVYHHFANKQGLFRAVYAEVEAEARRRSAAAMPPDATPIQTIIAAVNAYLDVTLDPEVQRVTLIDGPTVLGLEPEGPPEQDPDHQSLRAFIATALDEGAIAAVDPDALAHLIGGACLQAGMLIARSPDPRSTRERVGATIEALINGLAPPPSGP